MAKNGSNFTQGIIGLTPRGTAPTSPQNGDFYYDSAAASFKFYNNGAWQAFSASSDVASAASLSSADFTATKVEGSIIRLTGSTAGSIHGVTASVSAKTLMIYNASSATMTFKHQSGTEGTAANRIITDTAADVTVTAGQTAQLFYDATQSRWVLIQISSGTTSSSGPGSFNLMLMDTSFLMTKTNNQDAETTVGDWAAYADAADTSPVDMTGGSPNTTITRTTSNPLDGAGSFLMTVTTGASRQGEGVSCLVNVPPGYRGKAVQLRFPFTVTGTLVEDDFIPYIYTIDGANAGIIKPFIAGKLLGSLGTVQCYFDIPSDCTQLRVGIHIARTSTGAVTIKFDDVMLTDVVVPVGMAGSDCLPLSGLTFTGLGTVSGTTAWVRRVGDSARIYGYTTAGTTDGTAFSIILPSGYSIDSTKLANTAKISQGLIYDIENNVANTFPAIGYGPHPVFYDGSTTDRMFAAKSSNTGSIFNKDSGSNLFATGATVSFDFLIPIAGWSSNVQMAQSSSFKISSYLANGSRVTGAAPTALGQYRSYIRTGGTNTWSETNGSPTTAPTVSDGIVLYPGANYATSDPSNQPTKYEIFVGKNKNVSWQFYANAARTGYANAVAMMITSNAPYERCRGYNWTYDPSTGIAIIWSAYFTGSESAREAYSDSNNNGQTSSLYFDIIVSENALAIGVDVFGLQAAGNYFGTVADGNAVVSSNTYLTSSTDGDMIVKNYGNLTIQSGYTLGVSNRCKGLLLYVKGDLTVDGTISMSSRGANVDPVSAGVSPNGLKIRRFTGLGTSTNIDSDLLLGCGSAAVAAENNQPTVNGNGQVWTIPRAGAAGVSTTGRSHGTTGNVGVNGQTGSGGSGGKTGGSGTGNASSAGTCFSGGSGGGSTIDTFGGDAAAAANGGAGGNSTGNWSGGGGAGNPGGSGHGSGGLSGASGTGGLLIIIVKGNVYIGAGGSIQANGAQGGGVSWDEYHATGGGSGGGSILLLHGGTFTNLGSVTANGGAGGVGASANYGFTGGAGGAGSVQINKIIGG